MALIQTTHQIPDCVHKEKIGPTSKSSVNIPILTYKQIESTPWWNLYKLWETSLPKCPLLSWWTVISFSLSKTTRHFVLLRVDVHGCSSFVTGYSPNSIVTAMMTQQKATQGLFRSPILAHFQKIPKSPVLFLSIRLGARALR